MAGRHQARPQGHEGHLAKGAPALQGETDHALPCTRCVDRSMLVFLQGGVGSRSGRLEGSTSRGKGSWPSRILQGLDDVDQLLPFAHAGICPRSLGVCPSPPGLGEHPEPFGVAAIGPDAEGPQTSWSRWKPGVGGNCGLGGPISMDTRQILLGRMLLQLPAHLGQRAPRLLGRR